MTRHEEGQGRTLVKSSKGMCGVPGCGRPVRAAGLCQAHYRHVKLHGKTHPIKPKRRPRAGTVRFGNCRVTPEAAAVLERKVSLLDITPNALITDILEDWARRKRKKR